MKIVQYQTNSKFGPIFLLASTKGLVGVHFNRQDLPLTHTLSSGQPAHQILKQTSSQLRQYLRGDRTKFDLPLVLEGTEFQKKVWRELAHIPYGGTCSYKDIAKRIHNPRAARAVGSANGKNPFCIILPCHRVIAADGSLGGYAYGINMKKELLGLEQASLPA